MQAGHQIIIAFKHGVEQSGQKQPVGQGQIAHDAEINRHQHAIIADKDIARMHVSVEKPVPEDLHEKTPGGDAGHGLNIMTGGDQPVVIINPGTVNTFHHQHALAAEGKLDPRDLNTLIISVVISQLARRRRLQPQVKFNIGKIGKLVHSMNQLEPPQLRGDSLHQAGAGPEETDIAFHPAAYPGAKDLDRHFTAISQHGKMNLGNRSRRHRGIIE